MVRMNYIVIRIIFMLEWFSNFFILFCFQSLEKSPFLIKVGITVRYILGSSKFCFSQLWTISRGVNVSIYFLNHKLANHTGFI